MRYHISNSRLRKSDDFTCDVNLLMAVSNVVYNAMKLLLGQVTALPSYLSYKTTESQILDLTASEFKALTKSYSFGDWDSLVVIKRHGICVQAAILTGRRSKTGISVSEIDDSVDRIVAGMEGTPMVDSKSKSLVAYHEVGHAVCGTLTPGTFMSGGNLIGR